MTDIRDGFREIVTGWMLVDDFDDLTDRIERAAEWAKAKRPAPAAQRRHLAAGARRRAEDNAAARRLAGEAPAVLGRPGAATAEPGGPWCELSIIG